MLTDKDEFPTPRVTFRVKNREECINKFSRKYRKTLEEENKKYEIRGYITDIIGIRVICLYETDIELIRNVLEKCFEVIEITDKTEAIESKDDVFGYKGLHLDLKLNGERAALPEYSRISDLQFEIQLRTIVQDAWSVLDHKIKYKRNIPHPLKRRINRMAALFELADQEFVNIKSETSELESRASKVEESAPHSQDGVEQTKSETIDALTFLGVAQVYFYHYDFHGYKVDGFVDELIHINPEITPQQLKSALEDNKDILEEYKTYQYNEYLNNLNPYTTIRHALYLSDKASYGSVLFDVQRKNFETWLESQNVSE